MRIRLVSLVVMLGLAAWASGQQPEARGTATTEIAGKKVFVEYGKPVLKGRSFADLMKQLPADRMWRAGSGNVTIFSTETDLVIGGKKVPAGKYSVYVHCVDGGINSFVLNSDLGQPLGKIWAAAPANMANEPYPHFQYTKEIGKQEVIRVMMKKISSPISDQLSYSFVAGGKGATLILAWGDQSWSVEMQSSK